MGLQYDVGDVVHVLSIDELEKVHGVRAEEGVLYVTGYGPDYSIDLCEDYAQYFGHDGSVVARGGGGRNWYEICFDDGRKYAYYEHEIASPSTIDCFDEFEFDSMIG